MKKKISSKDLKDWKTYIKNLQEIEDKDIILNKNNNKNYIKIIDLHGLTFSEANKKVIETINTAYDKGIKKVKIITGKGLRSKNLNNPFVSKYMNTLKNSIPEFIKKDKIKNKIISTLPALPGDGGSGAFYILIKKKN